MYGKLPSRSDHFAKHLKDRKYFDSGDYAMSKAGKGDSVDAGAVGSQHPVPENIPHLSSPVSGSNGLGNSSLHPHHQHQHQHQSGLQAGSPVKESSFLNRETSAEDVEGSGAAASEQQKQEGQPQQQEQDATKPPAEGTAPQVVAGEKAELPVRR